MKKIMRYARSVCNLFCVLLCLMCILLPLETPAAVENTVTGTFTNLDHTVSWDYPYSKDYFRLPSDEYNHDFARLSLGLSLAAFRDTDHPEAQDDYLITFLEEMEFDEIETDTFHADPESYSIGYGLASLPLDDNTTVIALAVCGGNYGAEWVSNLTMGDDVRPEGFQDASLKVEDALKDYMERHPVDGDVKLWITGYSRGAAVSNIMAADCTDSGIFKDVYAYTFATPRTTREPGDYHNIFNILQKNDVVPKIPLADWGFRRYGIDLFLVSPEIDMECADVTERADALYTEMLGAPMVWNFEINYQLRILADYLYLLLQTPAEYTEYLQPLILDILTEDEGTKDALQVLLEALMQYSDEDDQHGEELQAMRDYLGTLISVYYLQDSVSQLPADQWDPEFGISNLFNDHYPFEYLAMMFASDDPEEVFSENTKYIRLVIYGDVDIRIQDGDKELKTILADGTELVDGVPAPDSLPYVDYYNEKTVISLPSDRSHTIYITSMADLPQTVTYTGLLCSGDTVQAEADDLYSFLMNPQDQATIITATGGRAIEPEASDHTDISGIVDAIYSPTTAMQLENNSVMHITISGLVNKLLLIIVLLLAQMIASIVLAIIRRKKHRKRNIYVALVWHSVIAAVFTLLEIALWYAIPILTLAKFIPVILVFIVFVVYALKGYWRTKKPLKQCLILIGALALFDILESMLIGGFAIWKSIFIIIVYIAFMTVAFLLLWKRNHPDIPQEESLTSSN